MSTAFRAFPLLLLLLPIASAQSADQPPKTYECYRAATPIRIDGKLDDQAWKTAPWTTDFVDIVGASGPKPRFRTRAKLLWDSTYLYIAAELQEPDLKATLTQHDSIIYHDNDFELFLKPATDNEQPGYFEFEINALNTTWDLYLNKPYLAGGKADSSWEIPGLKTAVHLEGTLNHSSDTDRGWTVEIAIPFAAFASRLPVTPPQAGSQWRANFSRVEWPEKAPGDTAPPAEPKAGRHPEDNWVWTPQYAVNMHIPERWGYINFRNQP